MAAKHWIGTIPKDSPNAEFWENPVTMEHIEYLKGQEEQGHGQTAYVHYQVYLVLKERKRLTWLKKHIHPTAHWEKKRGTIAEAVDYVSKMDTRVPGGKQFEFGTMPKEGHEVASAAADAKRLRDKDDIKLDMQGYLDRLNKGEYIAWRDIPVDVQLQPGFLMAYKQATKDMLGPMREDLKIITLIGPPGCGKSYAIAKLFPQAGKWLKGNNGSWFCNAKSDVMVFEEFSGQIELQNMLKYLDPYPLCLEVKGGTEPANYRLVIITSNTPIDSWYTTADEFKDKPGDPTAQTTSKRRRTDALGALWDRLGYKALLRGNGRVYAWDPEQSKEQILAIRDEIMEILTLARDELYGDVPSSQPMPLPEIEELPEDDSEMDKILDGEETDSEDDTALTDLVEAAAAADTDDEDTQQDNHKSNQ